MRAIFLIPLLIFINNDQMKTQNKDFTEMIKYAIQAPSGHNTQPWLFRINDNSIEIHPNMYKALPVVDTDNRELFISLGCATENLCIAASEMGYRHDITISESSIITVTLSKDSAVNKDPLFNQILLRQTNRSVYNYTSIADDTIRMIKEIPLQQGIRMHFYKNGSPAYDTITNYVVKGNSIQMGDKYFKHELKSWMRFNKKHQDKTQDGLSYAAFGAPNLPAFIARPIIGNAINVKSQNKADIKKIGSSSHFILFTCDKNSMESWIYTGMMLERVLLEMTRLNIMHAYCNQPNEIRELSEEMAKSLHIGDQHPVILLRIGYGKKMPYSLRKDINEVIIK